MIRNEPFGIDLSSHNEHIDVDKLRAFIPRVEFAWARTGESWGYKDPKFDIFRDQFENQLGIWFGGYHILYPGQPALDQVKNFINIAGKNLRGYAWDVELVHGCTPLQIRECMRIACEETLNLGLPTWGYTSPGWANSWIIPDGVAAPAFFAQIKWWLAQYTGTDNEHPGPLMEMNGVKPQNVYIHQSHNRWEGYLIGQPSGSPHFDGNRWLIGAPIQPTPQPEPEQPSANTRLIDIKTIQTGMLNIRRGAGTNYGVAGTLLRGNVVECLEYKLVNGNTWARVGQAQWIAAIYNGQNYIA